MLLPLAVYPGNYSPQILNKSGYNSGVGKYYLGASPNHILLNHSGIIFVEPCVCFFHHCFEKSCFINRHIGDLAVTPFGDESAHNDTGDYEDLPLGQSGFLKILFKISPSEINEYLSSLFIKFFIVRILLVRVELNVLHDIHDVRISLRTYDIQRDSVSFTILDNGHIDRCESLYVLVSSTQRSSIQTYNIIYQDDDVKDE